MSYTVHIRNNATGEVRACPMDGDIERASPNHPWDISWWTDGNASCDCNRAIFYGDDDQNKDDGCPCGDGGYSVLGAVLGDGTCIPIHIHGNISSMPRVA